jgi:hypothetical protein
VRAIALGVDDALGHALAVEMLHLLHDVVVVQNDRAGGAHRQGVLVAGGRDPGVVGGGGATRIGQALALSRPPQAMPVRPATVVS